MTVKMRTVEFQVPGAVNGTTPAPVLSFDPNSPNYKEPDDDGIVRFTPEDMLERTGGDLGLFDPDFGVGGSFADRFLQLLEVVTAGAAGAVNISIVDAEDLVQQEEVYAGPEASFYDRDTILVPQGSELSFSGFTATPGQPVVIRINVVTWESGDEYARLREVACCTGGAGPVPPPPGGIGPTFVYRPGGIPGDNVYADWGNLIAAVDSVEGPKWVEVDDTFVAIPLIPAGVWDLNDAILQGRPIQQQTTLRGSVGSRLQNVGGVQQNLQLQNNDPAAALVSLSALNYFDVRDGASLASLVATPVVEWAGAGAVVLRLQGARLQDIGLGPAFGVTGGAGNSAVLESYDGSVVDDDTLEVAAGSILNVRLRDLGSSVSHTQTLVAGTINFGTITDSGSILPIEDSAFDFGDHTHRMRQFHNKLDVRAGPDLFFPNDITLTYEADAVGLLQALSAGYGTGDCEAYAGPYVSLININGRVANFDAGGSKARLRQDVQPAWVMGAAYMYGGALGDEASIDLDYGVGSLLGGISRVSYTAESSLLRHGPGSAASFTWAYLSATPDYSGGPIVEVTGRANDVHALAFNDSRLYARDGVSVFRVVMSHGAEGQYCLAENYLNAFGCLLQGRLETVAGYDSIMRTQDDVGWATGRINGGTIETRAGQVAWARGFATNGGSIYAAGHASTAWGWAQAGETIGVVANNADQWGVGVNDLADSSRFGVGWRLKKTVGAPAAPADGDCWIGAGGSMYVRTNGVTKNLDAI